MNNDSHFVVPDGSDTESDESSSEHCLNVHSQKIHHNEAVESLNIILNWADENNVDLKDISCLRKLREKAVLNCLAQTKQSTITHYFSKQ